MCVLRWQFKRLCYKCKLESLAALTVLFEHVQSSGVSSHEEEDCGFYIKIIQTFHFRSRDDTSGCKSLQFTMKFRTRLIIVMLTESSIMKGVN